MKDPGLLRVYKLILLFNVPDMAAFEDTPAVSLTLDSVMSRGVHSVIPALALAYRRISAIHLDLELEVNNLTAGLVLFTHTKRAIYATGEHISLASIQHDHKTTVQSYSGVLPFPATASKLPTTTSHIASSQL